MGGLLRFPRIQLLTIAQFLAGVAIERPSGSVAVDETFKKAPRAKAKGGEQGSLGPQTGIRRKKPCFPGFFAGDAGKWLKMAILPAITEAKFTNADSKSINGGLAFMDAGLASVN